MKQLIFLCFVIIIMTGCTKKSADTVDQPIVPVIEENQPTPEVQPQPEIAPPVAPSPTISGIGTEPFWNFTLSGSTLTRNQPNNSGTIDTTTYTTTLTQTPTTVTIIAPSFNALLTLQACSDGMSENTYTHSAVITLGTGTFNGCANVTP